MQLPKVLLQGLPAVLARHTVDARGGCDTPSPALSPARGSLDAFPLADRLPSTTSSPGRPGSFGSFAGTTRPSDFPCSCIKGLPPKRSPHGPPHRHTTPRTRQGRGITNTDGRPRDLPVLSMKSFVHAQVLRPRGAPQQLAIALLAAWPSANDEGVGTPDFRSVTRLNSPACTTPTDTSPPPSRAADARLGAIERIATPSM